MNAETFTDVQVRILGSLIEKEHTTPEYYPMTLNALRNACNQKSNRAPVMTLDDGQIRDAVFEMRKRNMVTEIHSDNARAAKYGHNLSALVHLQKSELAVMCILMLRGPQTLGEINSRTARIYTFSGLAEVAQSLEQLKTTDVGPLVKELTRKPGQKEGRVTHLLCGDPVGDMAQSSGISEVPSHDPRVSEDRIKELEQTVQGLKSDFDELRKRFERFAEQFQ